MVATSSVELFMALFTTVSPSSSVSHTFFFCLFTKKVQLSVYEQDRQTTTEERGAFFNKRVTGETQTTGSAVMSDNSNVLLTQRKFLFDHKEPSVAA